MGTSGTRRVTCRVTRGRDCGARNRMAHAGQRVGAGRREARRRRGAGRAACAHVLPRRTFGYDRTARTLLGLRERAGHAVAPRPLLRGRRTRGRARIDDRRQHRRAPHVHDPGAAGNVVGAGHARERSRIRRGHHLRGRHGARLLRDCWRVRERDERGPPHDGSARGTGIPERHELVDVEPDQCVTRTTRPAPAPSRRGVHTRARGRGARLEHAGALGPLEQRDRAQRVRDDAVVRLEPLAQLRHHDGRDRGTAGLGTELLGRVERAQRHLLPALQSRGPRDRQRRALARHLRDRVAGHQIGRSQRTGHRAEHERAPMGSRQLERARPRHLPRVLRRASRRVVGDLVAREHHGALSGRHRVLGHEHRSPRRDGPCGHGPPSGHGGREPHIHQ